MNSEGHNISSDRGPKIIAWIYLAVLCFAYFLTFTVLAPSYRIKDYKRRYGFVQEEKNPVDQRIFSDSAYLSLLRENAFLQSRISIAATDSVYMSVNLADSVINLEISGIVVHTAHISRMSLSNILRRGDNYVILSMLSHPLSIKRNFASIRKEPLMIKKAPRDTSEYVPDIIPDTTDYEPVNIIFETDNGIRFHIYQEAGLKTGDGLRRFIFDMYHRFRYSSDTFIKIITFRMPDYKPYIRIRIPRADAKIIYRALPEKGQIALSK